MAEYHPFLTHFPIALYITAALLEIVRFRLKNIPVEVSISLVIVAAVISILTALSGNAAGNAAQVLPQISEDLLQHEQWGNVLPWSGIVSAIVIIFYYLKSKINKTYLLILLLFLALMALNTGRTGHRLVFKYGAGTELVK